MANGKVKTGFEKPYVAKYNASGGVVFYTEGMPLARGVEVNLEPESSEDNNFYADNQLAESASGVFTGGTMTLTVDGLKIKAERFIMGLSEPDSDGFTAYGDGQAIPYVGVGYLVRYMEDDVPSWVPHIVVKTKFNQVGTNAATQEEEIDWQTQELTATIMRGDDANHNWKYVGRDYATAEEAEAALKAKLNITESSYSIAQVLTHVTSDYSDSSIDAGEELEVNLTADSGYEIDTVTVTMGGVDITSTAYTDGTVSIAAVTGNVVITATASTV